MQLQEVIKSYIFVHHIWPKSESGYFYFLLKNHVLSHVYWSVVRWWYSTNPIFSVDVLYELGKVRFFLSFHATFADNYYHLLLWTAMMHLKPENWRLELRNASLRFSGWLIGNHNLTFTLATTNGRPQSSRALYDADLKGGIWRRSQRQYRPSIMASWRTELRHHFLPLPNYR